MNKNLTRFVTLREASQLCDCSWDKIKDWRSKDRFASARQRDDAAHTWEVSLADLVQARLLDPATLPDDVDLADLLPRPRLERDLHRTQVELAVTKEQLIAAHEQLRRSDLDRAGWERLAHTLAKAGHR